MDAREIEFLRTMADNQRKIFADPEARRFHFEHLVISGIWIIILLLCKFRAADQMINWRSSALNYTDALGNQNDGALSYRRERTYAEPNWQKAWF
jgi:hypothetical protein